MPVKDLAEKSAILYDSQIDELLELDDQLECLD
jgi:hypothetical protein